MTVGGSGFGPSLADCRRQAGMSQRMLADRAGVSVAAIRDLEQGRTRRPRRSLVDAAVAALELTGDVEAALRRAAADPVPNRPARSADDGPVRIRVLGPLQVHRGPEPVPVGRGRRRAVLGRLALSADDVVAQTDLVDLLWGEDAPPTAAQILQTYVSRLRAALLLGEPAHAGVLSRTPGGYRLSLDDDQLDLADFRLRVVRARTAQPAAALDALETAVTLWSGEPLHDVPELRGHPLVTAATEERIAAVLLLADLALAQGRPERCLPHLRALAAVHPFHEPLHVRLIAALAAGNLQAAALDTFADIRLRLADELGIDPSPQLVDAHRRVLRQQHAQASPTAVGTDPPPVPAQLPADVRTFTGRTEALARLDGVLGSSQQIPAVGIAVVSGTAGVGKTALAVHWAHRVRSRFPDGQLHVNLRGFHPVAGPMPAGEALHGFLLALGVDPHRVPAGLDVQSALFRTLVANRRMLILVDNARSAADVRPLLPGTAGCLVLVTSRHRLTGLVAGEAAHQVPLDLLAVDDARLLLTRRVGTDRAALEPDAVDAVVEHCARLPLALAVASALAGVRSDRPLGMLAAQLQDSRSRLDQLTTGEPGTDLRAVLFCSYRQLGPDAARLFRHIGLHPGVDIDAAAAAGLAGSPVSRTLVWLAELTDAHLMVEPVPGRYTFHDLLHAYAAERTAEEDPEPARRAALDRLFDHYLTTARAAIGTLYPGDGPPDPEPAHTFADPAAARAWLDAERNNLVALGCHGARDGRPAHTIALAGTLFRYLDSGHFSDGLTLLTHAWRAARRQKDHAAEATALNHLGITHRRCGRYAEAGELHRRTGDRRGEAQVLVQIGVVEWRLGNYDRSRGHHQAALDLFRDIGDRLGEAQQLNNFGIGNRQTGHYEVAVDFHRQALTLLRELGHRLGEADVLNTLGTTHRHGGDDRRGIECHRQAGAIFRDLGHRPGQAHVLTNLGRAYLGLGDPSAAIDHHQRALAEYRAVGDRSLQVEAINALGAAQLAAGDLRSAHATYTTALELAENTGDRNEQAVAHEGLADAHHAADDIPRAVRHWRRALTIYTDLGLPDAERVADSVAAQRVSG